MNIPSFDSGQYKAGLRREWSTSADGWKRHWNIWEKAAQHIDERLVDLARIRSGQRVLDIATGLERACLYRGTPGWTEWLSRRDRSVISNA